MDQADYDFFRANGYLVLGKVLSDGEVTRFVRDFDRNHGECAYLWRYLGTDTHQTGNCDALPSWVELDDIVRHRLILPVVHELMDDTLSILEVSARHMDIHPGPVKVAQQWHRDTPHLESHPLRMDYIQAMVYLTDVSEGSHCFTISPESVDDPVLDRDEQLSYRGMKYLHGPAGTVILFNASVMHTATVRATPFERKTIQIYYCHRDAKLGKLELYNLRADPSETRDLAGSETDRLKKMGRRLQEIYMGVQKDCPTWPEWEWARYEQERIQWPPYRGKRKVELRIPKIPPPTNFK